MYYEWICLVCSRQVCKNRGQTEGHCLVGQSGLLCSQAAISVEAVLKQGN